MEDGPKLGWKTVELAHPIAVAHLEEALADCLPSVMIYSDCRWGRSHLRLHRDRGGFFVRMGRRGSSKHYLGRCKITYLDGVATLFQFTTASHDAYKAEESRRWDAREAARRERTLDEVAADKSWSF